MQSSDIITWMIFICLIFTGLMIFSKPIKYILKFFVRAFCGMFLASIFNFVLAPLNIAIGFNYLNFFVIGILGLPGFISLYIISWLV